MATRWSLSPSGAGPDCQNEPIRIQATLAEGQQEAQPSAQHPQHPPPSPLCGSTPSLQDLGPTFGFSVHSSQIRLRTFIPRKDGNS